MVYSTDRSKAIVTVLVVLFVALWFILRAREDLFYASPFSIAITSLGEDLILVLFVCLFDSHLFRFVCFLILLVSGKGYNL